MTIASLESNPSVLLIKPSSLGDVIHTFPVVRAIKKRAPHVQIDWVVAEIYAPLVRMSPYVSDIIPFKRGEWSKWWKPSTLRDIYGHAKIIRENDYGAIVDLQGLLRSGLITFAARSPVKIGFDYAREGAPMFYSVKIQALEDGAHAVDRYMSALAGLEIIPDGEPGYDLEIPSAEALWADINTPDEPFAAINPNSRWDTKRWPVEKFGQLARELFDKKGIKSVIIGGPEDEERSAAVARLAGPEAVNLTGKGGLTHLAAVLKRAEILFTNDSGPLHLAVAVGTPTVSFFGPTDPGMTGPYGPGHIAVKSGVDCSPCFGRRCPTNLECMNEISPDQAIEAWNSLKLKV